MSFAVIKKWSDQFFEWEYSFYQSYLHFFAWLGAFSHLGFYFYLKYQAGYVESEFLRFGAIILFLGFLSIPKSGELKLPYKIYMEFTFLFQTPILFSYLMLMNETNIYWFGSMTFCGLLYGLLSQPLIAVIGYLVTTFFTLEMISRLDLIPELNYELSVLAYSVGFMMLIIALTIKFAFVLSSKRMIILEVAKNKLIQLEENVMRLEQRDKLISAFTRPSLLTEVSLGTDPTLFKPRRNNISVMFADLMNYTSITEKLSLEECYDYLNDYFALVSNPIYENFGEIDKLIGDAVMATFNDVENCLNSCLTLRKNVSESNRERSKSGQPLIKFGTGLAYGEVLTGNFGSKEKIDRTVIGDVVNVCARLESLTRKFQISVLATGDFVRMIQSYENKRLVAFTSLKGKNEKVEVFEIFGYEKEQVVELKNKQKVLLEECIYLYRDGLYDDALKIVRQLIKECPTHTYHHNKLMDPYLLEFERLIQSKSL